MKTAVRVSSLSARPFPRREKGRVNALKKTVCAIVLALVLYGCAGAQKELLEKDYLPMTNAELLTYYDNLTAEIARCQGGRDSASVGLGTGGYRGGGGLFLGLGLSHSIPLCDPGELIERRSEVRVELDRWCFKP
ncbi:MAG TPA: hypothetical protein PK545_02740 [Deltaproteobacteria bacterium]|nr:hypothetical protein [Deltaproteobacteria bacterium]